MEGEPLHDFSREFTGRAISGVYAEAYTADVEAGYIYHSPSAFGKEEVRIARDDEEQYNVFIARVNDCAALMGEEGAIAVHTVGFARGRSASAGPSLPLATASASATGPAGREPVEPLRQKLPTFHGPIRAPSARGSNLR